MRNGYHWDKFGEKMPVILVWTWSKFDLCDLKFLAFGKDWNKNRPDELEFWGSF